MCLFAVKNLHTIAFKMSSYCCQLFKFLFPVITNLPAYSLPESKNCMPKQINIYPNSHINAIWLKAKFCIIKQSISRVQVAVLVRL